MTHINKNGKVIRIIHGVWLRNRGNPYEAARQIINREMAYYEKNWPFVKYKTFWQKFFSMFNQVKIVRRIKGGTWVRGDTFGIWLHTNEHFRPEWLEDKHHEVWK